MARPRQSASDEAVMGKIMIPMKSSQRGIKQEEEGEQSPSRLCLLEQQVSSSRKRVAVPPNLQTERTMHGQRDSPEAQSRVTGPLVPMVMIKMILIRGKVIERPERRIPEGLFWNN